MIEYKLVPPSPDWHKKVQKLTEEYNSLVRKKKYSKIERVIIKIEDGIINEEDLKKRRDYAFLIQIIEGRHEESIFHPEIIKLHDYLLGGNTSDEELFFKEPGGVSSSQTPPATGAQQEQFNIESIDLKRIHLLNLEIIQPNQLEKANQKCAFGDGEILLSGGVSDGDIWRCKKCGTVYHENCLRICLLTKGSCLICDEPYLNQ
ncbi:MAG: hypothetical protein ACTSUE_27550 [Promethearchaeota archaeon]